MRNRCAFWVCMELAGQVQVSCPVWLRQCRSGKECMHGTPLDPTQATCRVQLQSSRQILCRQRNVAAYCLWLMNAPHARLNRCMFHNFVVHCMLMEPVIGQCPHTAPVLCNCRSQAPLGEAAARCCQEARLVHLGRLLHRRVSTGHHWGTGELQAGRTTAALDHYRRWLAGAGWMLVRTACSAASRLLLLQHSCCCWW